MPADLLWNGGIGTYVKSSEESNAEAGDRTNDPLRINGTELRAKVVGEGGNLGLTQRGRVEYALAGGRLNTDFIDNSAGVNTSDVEVNIKILLNPLMQAGKLTRGERNKLLARMTNEVAALVLRNNYLQSQAISTLELQTRARLPEFQHLIRSLERSGDLNRTLEFLPADDELVDRRKRGVGLSRPELSILLAYSKIWLTNHLLASDVPEDPYLSTELVRYFPEPRAGEVRARQIAQHRLPPRKSSPRRPPTVSSTAWAPDLRAARPGGHGRAARADPPAPTQPRAKYSTCARPGPRSRRWTPGFRLKSCEYSRWRFKPGAWCDMSPTGSLTHRRKRQLQVDAAVAEFRKGVRQLGVGDCQCAQRLGDRERFWRRFAREHVDAGGARAGRWRRVSRALPHQRLARTSSKLPRPTKSGWWKRRVCTLRLARASGLDWSARPDRGNSWWTGPWQAIARTGLRDGAMRIHRRLAERVLARNRSKVRLRLASLRGWRSRGR